MPSELMDSYGGGGSHASSPLEKHMSSDSHMLNHSAVPNLYLNQDHKLQTNTVGSGGRAVGPRPLDNRPMQQRKPYLMVGNRYNNNVNGDYENGLFSSSLSDLFTTKVRLQAANNSSMYGRSVGDSHHEEEEPFESLEEIEAQTIGNLLPDDDDLLSGVTDGLDCNKLQQQPPGSGDELDLFSSVGGMELGELNMMKFEPSRSKLLNSPFPELDLDEATAMLRMRSHPTDFTRDISGSVPNAQVTHGGNLFGGSHAVNVSNGFPSSLHSQPKYDFRRTPNSYPHSLPEYQDDLTSNGILYNSPSTMAASLNGRMSQGVGNRQFNRIEPNNNVFGNASGSPTTHHHMWNPSHNMRWPNGGVVGSHMANTFLHHVGSAPSVNPSIRDASVFHPGSLGSMRVPGSSPHPLDFVSHNMFPPRMGGNSMDPKNIGLASHHQNNVLFPSRGQMMGSPNRSRSNSNQGDNKKQFELDLDRIMRGEDRRTTLMIKNIPNKYTSKMLLAAIDERHRGTYDFIYLPIDFKNKCNVGYAFINMVEPSHIIPFYQAFNGKKWEKFNSEKVASLAYGRIQGKAALIAHFQNSSLMNEDKRCRPILFHTDGPNAGDQVPFPMGVNVRSRVNKNSQDVGGNVEGALSSSSSGGSTKDFEC